jgi:flagellum-specific ATP synthase
MRACALHATAAARQAGRDSELDQAVQLVPNIYDVLQQHPTDPSCAEPFQELLSVIKTAIG